MIRLFQFPPAFGIPNVGPFCMKVETYLRMVGLEFETVDSAMPNKAPKRKLPYIVDKGRAIPDSSFILRYLKESYGDPLDVELDAGQHALGHLVCRTLEESFYFALLYSRWADDRYWPTFKDGVFGSLPAPLRAVVPIVARRQTKGNLEAQGMGRHSPREVYELGVSDLTAIAHILGETDFLLGAKPSSYDATLYAFLANLLDCPIDSPLREHAAKTPTFLAYNERMRRTYYAGRS